MRGAGSAVWLVGFLCIALVHARIEELNITVPATYKVDTTDAYVCAIAALPVEAHKLVGVVPLADQSVVHHILLYGCELPVQHPEPGQIKAWDCAHHGVCGSGGSQIIYGWGRNAPQFNMPPGVAFSVGASTQMRYIVAQVHFKGARPPNDASGVTLLLKPHATPYAAGVITFASMFSIPPNTASTKIPTECCYSGHQPLTTVAFRVHTHVLGRSVTMERPMWNHTGTEVIATNDPQLPQAFYPVRKQVIWPGDRLKVTCDFDSRGRDRVTEAGPTSEHEMCNMYMMVYAPHPFISMCTGGPMGTGDNMPGTMPRDAQWTLDPCMFWKPPGRGLGSVAAPGGGAQDIAAADQLGDITGVAVAGDGGLWAFYRGDRRWDGSTFKADFTLNNPTPIDKPVLVKLDSDTGKVVEKIGAGMFGMPHMITLDKDGAIWAVDVGLHQVIKLDPQGKEMLRVGTPGAPGRDATHLCLPTHVAVARDGTFYVADGYCNSRVVKFAADGKYLGEVQIPAPNGPSVVHSVALDECTDTLYIAARETGKVYLADSDKLQVTQEVDLSRYGRVWSIVMGAYGMPLALTWELNKDAMLVQVQRPDAQWVLPGMASLFPHQIALGAGPPTLSGAADRMFALYVAPTCATGCGPLRRYVLVPKGFQLPDPSKTQVPVTLPALDGAGASADKKQPQPQQTGTTTPAKAASTQQQPQKQQHSTQAVNVVERHSDPKTDSEYGVVVTSSAYGVVSPGWQGAMGMRVVAVVVFAAIMAVVVGVLTRRIMRKFYGDTGGTGDASVGRRASMDQLLARSAELEGLEDGHGGASRSPTALQYRTSYNMQPEAFRNPLTQPETASRSKDRS